MPTNEEITFNIRLNNTTGQNYESISNGFRVYSPDGATWGSVRADTMNFGWEDMFDFAYTIRDYSNTGYGADTVSFFGISMFSDGLTSNFNDVAYQITIGPFDESDIGKTVCLDSSFFRASGVWHWYETPDYYYPDWDGPHCYEIRGDSIYFSGTLYYQDPVPPDTNRVPVRNTVIELWDDDLYPISDDLLRSTTTDEYGNFEFGPVENYEYVPGNTNLDIYLKTYADNDAVYVTESYNGDIYEFKTETGEELPSGVYDTIVDIPLDLSGPFFIADCGLDAKEGAENLGFAGISKLQIENKIRDTNSFYNHSDVYVHIEKGEGNFDSFDRDVIYHEYAHKLEDENDFFDLGGGHHEWLQASNQNTASSEGFAYFFCHVLNNDPVLKNYYHDLNMYAWYNSENGETNTDLTYGISSANNGGKLYDAGVGGILWDIYDNIDDDYSTYGVFPIPNDSTPDGIGDTLTDGYLNIFDVLLDRTVNGHRPDNITEFWEAWFQSPSKGHTKAMMDIWYEHGELTSCCIGLRGNADNDPDDLCDIGDINYLVEYQFNDGPPPVCFEEADVDGDLQCDIGDINLLVEWQFGTPPGPPPISCP